MKRVDKCKNILVIRLSAMGDVAMSAPLLREFVSQNKNVNITVLTTPFNISFFEHIPSTSVYAADVKNKHIGLWGIFTLFLKLNKYKKFDVVIDLHDVIRSKLLRKLYKLTGTKVCVIDKGRKEKEALTAIDDKVFRPLKTTIERYADTFRKAGFEIKLAAAVERVSAPIPEQILALCKQKSGRWIGIAPFAQHKGKIYPLHLMEEVIEMICDDSENTVFLFGGGMSERNVTEKFEKKYKNCYSIIGRMPISKEIDLISNLDCMVSMDSVAMHMASIVGIRVVSIWGATHTYAGFLGYGQSEADVISLNLSCRPCSIYGNKPCYKETYECLYNISPKAIVDKVLER